MPTTERLPPVIAALKGELERQGHTVTICRNSNGDRRYRINNAAWGLPGDMFIRRAEALTLGRAARRA